MLMDTKTCDSKLHTKHYQIHILTKRVNLLFDHIDQIVQKQNECLEREISNEVKLNKILDRLFEKPEYYSVGEIALKEGVSVKTVRRKIRSGDIPSERSSGEKSYRIPSDKYYGSLTASGDSSWFQNYSYD